MRLCVIIRIAQYVKAPLQKDDFKRLIKRRPCSLGAGRVSDNEITRIRPHAHHAPVARVPAEAQPASAHTDYPRIRKQCRPHTGLIKDLRPSYTCQAQHQQTQAATPLPHWRMRGHQNFPKWSPTWTVSSPLERPQHSCPSLL